MWYRNMMALSVALLAACGSVRPQQSQSSLLTPAAGRVTLITADMIGTMSAESAWDVIQRRAPDVMRVRGSTRLSSLSSREPAQPPLVVIDGTPFLDLRPLYLIRAADVHTIRILGSSDGSSIYGPRAAGGAIEVITKG